MYEDCCDCVTSNALRDALKNALFHVFFKEFCEN